MGNGILSQAIVNIQQLAATLNGFQGLPPQAIGIQHDIVKQLNAELLQLISLQQQVLTVGAAMKIQLNQLIADFNNQSVEQLSGAVLQLQREISPLAQLVSQAFISIQNMDASITQNNLIIQQISVSLQSDIVGLQSRLASAKQEAEELNNKKLYLLSLGILGVPGLIALAILLSNAQDDVNDLNGQINQIKMHIQSQKGFLTQTEALSANFSDAVDKVSRVENTISFLNGNIDNITQDISAVTLQQLQLFFVAAQGEINTLITDAS